MEEDEGEGEGEALRRLIVEDVEQCEDFVLLDLIYKMLTAQS